MFLKRIRLDYSSADDASSCDQTPFWSAPFGTRLLETVSMRPGMRVLDIGTGTGFPLLELAMRLGGDASLAGIDPWVPALERARFKARLAGITNVALVEGVAESLPFPDAGFDLIISNNGLNNVADARKALSECFRVSKPGCQLVATMNLPETMTEFYGEFRAHLRAKGLERILPAVEAHISGKRKTVSEIQCLIAEAGFHPFNTTTGSFSWRFVDFSAFLNHWSVNALFLPHWLELLPGDGEKFLGEMAEALDPKARGSGGFTVTIPFACFDARKNQT